MADAGGGRDRGVSHVVAVVMLIGVVLVMVTILGSGVLSFGERTQEPTPTVAITPSYDQSTGGSGQSLTLTVEGGDAVAVADLELQVDGAVAAGGGSTTSVELDGDPLAGQAGSRLDAGTTITLSADDFATSGGSPIGASRHLDLSDAEVRIVWTPPDPDTDQTHVLWDWSA